jgi:chemotaxis protein histidine kinase CheA
LKSARRRSLVVFANTADERFAVPLGDLLRLERVDKAQLEKIGEKPFLKHRGRAIPLVHLEDHLPVGGNSAESDEFFVLIRSRAWGGSLRAHRARWRPTRSPTPRSSTRRA